MQVIDPVCAFHGLRRSKHFCLYCCLCFKILTVDECYISSDGTKEDVCMDCAVEEAFILNEQNLWHRLPQSSRKEI